MIEKALRTFLLSQTSITNIVGSSAVYLGRRQDHSGVAAITIASSGGAGEYVLSGEADVAAPILLITCWVRGPATDVLDNLYDAVRLAVSGKRATWGTVEVEGCTLEGGSGRILQESPRDGDKLWWFGRILNLRVTYRHTPTWT